MVDKDTLIQDYQRVATELGKRPTLSEYNDHGAYSSTPIYDEFESFEALKDAAGYEKGEHRIPSQDLIDDLHRVADKIGRAPPIEEYREHGDYNFKTVKRRWGSWHDVLENAGFDPTDHSKHWKDTDYSPTESSPTVEVDCDYCGGPTEKTERQLERFENAYCSEDCQYAALAEETGPDARAWDGGMVRISCHVCGVDFPVKPSKVDARRCCSPTCDSKWREERYSGESHPRWTDDPIETHYGPSYPSQRQKALERDNYECRVCGRTNAENKELFNNSGLNAHHIIKFRLFDSHEEANVLENLVMLCSQCHQFVEHGKIDVPVPNWHRQKYAALLHDMPVPVAIPVE